MTVPDLTGPCWSDFCIASLCDGVHHVDATGYTWTEPRTSRPAGVPGDTSTTVTCPACRGEGERWYPGEGNGDFYRAACDTCTGTGSVGGRR